MPPPLIYDGTGKLVDAIVALYGYSPKNQTKTAELIKQAKAALGITSKAKRLPDDVKRSIYQWHHGRLHPAANEAVEIIQQPESVETISQSDNELPVEVNSQTNDANSISSIKPDDAVETFSRTKPVKIYSHYRIAFYVQKGGKRTRQVIALEGYYLNALAAIGISKADVPKWIQAQVDGWAAFDPDLPITKQIKYLIVRALTTLLE